LEQQDAITDAVYSKQYPYFLVSPSDKITFWTDPTNTRNNLFLGDSNGQNGKFIMNVSGYNAYGWYTDNYLLVSENSNELFIMPADGSKPPVKVSDYFRSHVAYDSYGGL
jgi:hypothetical protein